MKNQATIEFTLLFTLLLLGVLVAAVVSSQKTIEVNAQQVRLDAEHLLESAAVALDTVAVQGDGFVTKLHLPDRIQGKQYTLVLVQNSLLLNLDQQDFSYPTIVRDFSGTLMQGENTLRNVRGVVNIS